MKKYILAVITGVLLLCSLCLGACGDNDTATTQDSSDSSQTSATTTTTSETSSSGSLTWNDMPVYSGADQVQKGSWTIPPAEGDYSRMEWRYYETGDSLEKVSAYYKAQMPKQGWQEMGWMEVQNMNWGMYNKNDENDAAMIWMSSEDNQTIIAMWRASR